MSYYQMPYTMMTGMGSLSNNAYQQAVQNAMLQNQMGYNRMLDYAKLLGGYGTSAAKNANNAEANNIGWQQNLGSMAGAGLGAYFGGPVGMQLGSAVGGMFGKMF